MRRLIIAGAACAVALAGQPAAAADKGTVGGAVAGAVVGHHLSKHSHGRARHHRARRHQGRSAPHA